MNRKFILVGLLFFCLLQTKEARSDQFSVIPNFPRTFCKCINEEFVWEDFIYKLKSSVKVPESD